MRIGFDIGGTKIEVVALSEEGKVIFRHRIPTPRTYEETVQAVCDIVIFTEENTGLTGTVGIGMPGTISPFTGFVKNANATWLNGKPFDRDIEIKLGRPIRCVNDANCLAVSESVDGVAAGAHFVFAVIIGTGCGAGIAVDGHAHVGKNGIGGEWGHNSLPWSTEEELAVAPLCYCGLHNCLETWISGTGFVNDYKRLTGQVRQGKEIVEYANLGDEFSILALDRYKDRLSRALAMVVNMLDPDAIVLGGGMSNVPYIYEGLEELICNRTFGREMVTPVLKAMYGDSSGVRGAAWLWN